MALLCTILYLIIVGSKQQYNTALVIQKLHDGNIEYHLDRIRVGRSQDEIVRFIADGYVVATGSAHAVKDMADNEVVVDLVKPYVYCNY